MRQSVWKSYLAWSRINGHINELYAFQKLTPEQARLDLGRRLMDQLSYFGKRSDSIPEWRDAASIRNPEDLWKTWTSLPIITKDDLRKRFNAKEIGARFGIKGYVSSTGGSTGEPTPFLHDAEMVRCSAAARIYCRLKIGWKLGMATICVWGSERDIGKASSLRARAVSYLMNSWMVDGYSLDDKTVERVLALMHRYSPVAIYGFSSMLEFVARRVLSRGEPVAKGKVVAAWNGGEMLFDRQSELFQEAFGVPILNYYGGRELAAMAYQPTPGSALEVLRPFLFLEILDDRGRPVAPGESGRLVWTSTVCRGTPFVRYDSGDLGCYNQDDQNESGILRIRELHGRQAGLLTLANGKTINCLFWNHLFKEFPEVEQFQVVLPQDREIHLRLKGQGFSGQRESELRSILGNFLGPLPISVDWVDKITLTKQGKLLQVVRE